MAFSGSPGSSGVPPGALFPGRGFSEFLNDPTFVPSLSENLLAPAAMVQLPGPGALALASVAWSSRSPCRRARGGWW